MTPDDFNLSILEDARRLHRFAISRSSGISLDARTSMWAIRLDGWRELVAARDYQSTIVHEPGPTGTRKQLMGLPVRVTIDDAPDTPMIQLVMEPESRS